MKFKESYDKIVNAYLKNELNPMSCEQCFVGNLLNNKNDWSWGNKNIEEFIRNESNNTYTSDDILQLENKFMEEEEEEWFDCNGNIVDEEGLYQAMERTLLLLKQIHENKGEVIEEYKFNKRELIPQL